MTQVGPGKVYLVTRNEGLQSNFGATFFEGGGPLQELFQVRDRTIVADQIPTQRNVFDRVVCFSEHNDGPEWSAQMRAALAVLCPGKPVQQVTPQLECVTCDPGGVMWGEIPVRKSHPSTSSG